MIIFRQFKRHEFFVGVLSFFMPGLGQIYLGKTILGMALFFGFVCALMTFKFFAPVVALLAAWLAYQAALSPSKEVLPSQAKPGRLRSTSFSGVAAIGFLGWLILMLPWWGPLEAQLAVNANADRVAKDIQGCRRRLRMTPQDISQCGFKAGRLSPDPWGNAFEYRKGKWGFELKSLGRDGQGGTRDDFVFRYR